MIWQFDILILVLLVVSAIVALRIRDLLSAALLFGIYSFFMCLLWADLRSDFAKVVLANSITLTPGTVTMKVEENTVYVHAISRKAAESLDGSMETRIARIFNEKGAS